MSSLLPSHQRTKLDPSSDRLFYELPRFVTHVDDGFIQKLTALYQALTSQAHRAVSTKNASSPVAASST